MDSDQVEVTHNVVVYSLPAAYGIDFKHGIAGAAGVRADYNTVIGSGYAGIAVDAIPNSSVRHNLLYNVCSLNVLAAVCSGGLQMTNQGGTVDEFKNIFFEYNTIVNAPAFGALNSNQTGSGGNIYGFRYNVVQDNRGLPYSADNSTNGFYYVAGYGTDAARLDVLARGISDYNCYFNAAGQMLRFSFFEASSGGWGPAGPAGQSYSGLSEWKAIFDRHSFEQDPQFDRYFRATSADCVDKGWLTGAVVSSPKLPPPTGQPSGTPHPTPTPIVVPTPVVNPTPTPIPHSTYTPQPRPTYSATHAFY